MNIEQTRTRLVGGRYELRAQLGAGAMGTVYRATDRLTGNIVALKRVTLPGDQLDFALRAQQDTDYRLALAHEFRTLASLRHPNIIHVLDYGFDAQNRPYFTMALLEGAKTILDASRDQSLMVQLRLIAQVLQALAYLHRRGILHRDLKPGNMLVTPLDQVKLLDFGLADALVHANGAVGTLAYMAPEVLRNQPLSQASDLYAVGVIVYQLVVGQHPFNVHDPVRLTRDILHRIPDLSVIGNRQFAQILAKWLEKDQDIGNRQFDQILAKWLEKDQDKRYGDANQLLADLRQLTLS
jgi:serine/threonine protein kinase